MERNQGASRLIQRGIDNVADVFKYPEPNIVVAVSPGPVDSDGRTIAHAPCLTLYSPDGLPTTMSLGQFVRLLISDLRAFKGCLFPAGRYTA